MSPQHTHQHIALAIAAVCCAPVAARASLPSDSNTPNSDLTHAVAAEYVWVAYATNRYTYSGQGVGLTYRLSWPHGFEVDAGLRALWGPQVSSNAAAEAFAGASLTPDFGFWRPRIGLEIGYSGVVSHKRPPDVVDPRGTDEDYRAAVSPLYTTLAAAPLRVRVGKFDIAALEVDVGTTLPEAGRALRLTVLFGQISWRI